VARLLKARAPDKHIALGGSHCEGEMGLALHEAYPFIDFVGRGESERLLVDLVASLSGEGPEPAAIPGLIWREGDTSRTAGERAQRIDDLNSLPIPAYDDWYAQLRAALPALPAHELELPFEASRGCWYGEKHHCTFCGLNGESMTFRSKSAARVLAELRGLARYDIPFVYAVDLIFDHRYFETLLPTLAKEAFGHTLFFETKSNLTRRQMQLLRDARIRLIQPGIESLSTPVLALMRKGVTACQNVRLLKWAAELGIAVFWNLLYGFPGESAEYYQKLAELLPALTHLMPPQGGYKVRVDRFSPLHFDAAALGVGPIRPAPAYAVVHNLPPDMIARLAYHFEPVNDGRSFDYMQPVAAAVRDWHEALGQSSFVALDHKGTLRLFDRRPITINGAMKGTTRGATETAAPATLEGLERAVYLACDAGATVGAVAAAVGEPETRVRDILAGFIERRWVVELDGRFLGLAVQLDEVVPASLPESVLSPMCHAIYVKRLLSLGRFFVGGEQPAPSP
jgi:ribosomal peptide maturation radical SAM protein 1